MDVYSEDELNTKIDQFLDRKFNERFGRFSVIQRSRTQTNTFKFPARRTPNSTSFRKIYT